jgi:hypothetical protein
MCQGPLAKIDITMSICKVLVICQSPLVRIDIAMSICKVLVMCNRHCLS